MEFKSYNDIDNHYKALRKAIDHANSTGKQVRVTAREKIHGANFAFWFDGIEHKQSSRNDFIEDAGLDNFYDCRDVVMKYRPCMVELFAFLKFSMPIQSIAVFGELAGDMKSGKSIQKGIKYGPMDFYVFDIRVTYTDGRIDYLSEPIEHEYLHFGFKTAPIVYIGFGVREEEILSLDNSFQSMILEIDEPNIAEGFVIKFDYTGLTNGPIRFNNGKRLIIKSKNEKWSEKGAKKSAPRVVTLSERDRALYEEVSQYLTENRVQNVLSKIGEPSWKDFAKVSGLVVADALKDFEQDGFTFEPDNDKLTKKYIAGTAADVVRDLFKAIIEE